MGLYIYGRHRKILTIHCFTLICTTTKRPFIQLWKSKCIESSKLFHYCNCKLTYDVASYVNIVDRDKFSRCLANVRGSSHDLMIKQVLDYGLPEEYRTCP